MIDIVMKQVASQLNQFLKVTFQLTEDIVVVSNILEQDGNVASHINNKLVMFLVNIEKETVPCSPQNAFTSGGLRTAVTNSPIHLNLYLMFAANFVGNNYTEALKFISHTISFFQGHPVFDHKNTPDMDRNIEKLILDIENLDIKDLSTLWGILSGKYLPSILYKVRMVTIDSQALSGQADVIRAPKPLVSG